MTAPSNGATSNGPHGSASPSRHWIYLIVLATMLAADLWSKNWAVEALEGGKVIPVIDGVLRFKLLYNAGMMWGMAQEVTATWWVIIRSGVLLGLIWLYFSLERHDFLTQLAFGLVTAGASGNIYDNIFQADRPEVAGHVRDFINFHWFEFPIFNVADSCICCGAPLLLIVLWKQEQARNNAAAAG